jgi:hypothetical protein
MSQPPASRPSRPAWGIITFLAAFAGVLLLVSDRYLLPAMRSAHGADPMARKQLAAISLLVLVIVLVALMGILFLVVRPGRLFLPRRLSPRTRTSYVDAWTESARRMQPPPKDP